MQVPISSGRSENRKYPKAFFRLKPLKAVSLERGGNRPATGVQLSDEMEELGLNGTGDAQQLFFL